MPRAHIIYRPYYKPKWLSSLFLCLVFVMSPACAQTGKKNYFPISDGAQWTYTGRFLPSTGGSYTARATIRIDGTMLIRGRRYYRHITSSVTDAPTAPIKPEQVRYYRAETGGIYFLPGNDLEGEERLAMPLPIPVGGSWLSGSVEVTAEHAGTIAVGRRKYANCLKLTYRQQGDARINEDYYAPGVGLVRSVYVNTTSPQSTIELWLESYHL